MLIVGNSPNDECQTSMAASKSCDVSSVEEVPEGRDAEAHHIVLYITSSRAVEGNMRLFVPLR